MCAFLVPLAARDGFKICAVAHLRGIAIGLALPSQFRLPWQGKVPTGEMCKAHGMSCG